MPPLDVVTIVAQLAAFALQSTKIFQASKPYWDRLPPWLQRVLPPVAFFLSSVPAAVASVATLPALASALAMPAVLALAMALPSKNPASPQAEKIDKLLKGEQP